MRNLCDPQVLIFVYLVFLLCNGYAYGQDAPHGTTHCYAADGVDTALSPNTAGLESATDFTFNDVKAIRQVEDTTYVLADNKLIIFENGRQSGDSVAINGECTPQRFDPPPGPGSYPPYVIHCASTDTGRPRYFSNQGLRTLPDAGSYLPQADNSILSRGTDVDGEDTTTIVVIAEDATSLEVYVIDYNATPQQTVELGGYCDLISAITYQEPSNGRIRFTITCLQDGEVKYYAVQLRNTFRLDTCEPMLLTGDVLSLVTSGPHVCMAEASKLTCFLSTQPSTTPEILTINGEIDNVEFLETAAGLFLLVEVDGAEQVVFAVSSGSMWERYSLPGSAASCLEKCLPHLVIDDHLLLFTVSGNFYKAQLYDLTSPLSEPAFRGNTRYEPRLAVFESQPAPPTTQLPTSPSPQPTSTSQPPPVTVSPTPKPTPTTSVTLPPTPNVSPSHSHLSTVQIVFIAILAFAAVVIIIILLIICAVGLHICRRRKRNKTHTDDAGEPHPPPDDSRLPPLQEKDQNATFNIVQIPGDLSGYSSMSSVSVHVSPDVISHDSGTGSLPLPFRSNSSSAMYTTTRMHKLSDTSTQAKQFSHSTSELVPGQESSL